MARALSGSSQGFHNTTTPPLQSNGPLTFCARVNLAALSNGWVCWMGDYSDGRSGHYIDLSSSAFRLVTVDSGGTAGVATFGSTASTGVPYSVVGKVVSNVSRTIYVNEGTPVTDTTNVPITTSIQDAHTIGQRTRDGIGSDAFLTANAIQDVAWWDVALTDNEITAFMRGVSPHLIRPASLRLYYPMTEPSGNIVSRAGVIHPVTMTANGSPANATPFATLPILMPRFGLASVAGGAAGNTTGVGAADGSSTAAATGKSTAASDGAAAGSSTASATSTAGNYGAAAGSSTATATGVSKAEAAGLAAGSSRARGIAPGGTSVVGSAPRRSSGGGRTFRGRRLGGGGGGSIAVNPSPPAGDALTQMLATMAVGEFRRISDPAYNLKTGPAALQGIDIYTREYYDAGYPGDPVFATEDDLTVFVQGTDGGGSKATDNARMIYAGMGLSQSRMLLMLFGGGHSSGGFTHGVCFDILTACANKMGGGDGGKWDQYTDPAKYDTTIDSAWPTPSAPGPSYFPQTIATGRLGPDNNLAPYALHNYSAFAFDEANDQWWLGGGSVAAGGGSLNPNGAWKIDAETRAVTLTTEMSMGGNSARLMMAPGGDYIWWNTTAGYVWYAHEIATETNTLVANNLGVTAAPGNGAACMWIRDLTTAGEYDLVFSYYAASHRLVKCPRQWTGSAPTSPARAPVYAPPGTDETASQTEEQCYTFASGVTRNWDSNSGFIYVEDQKKIFTFGIDAGEILIQTIDPFQGNATGQATWHVDNWLGGYAGLSGDKADIVFPTAGVNNLVQYLPAYKAAVLVSNETRGDVRILKLAA